MTLNSTEKNNVVPKAKASRRPTYLIFLRVFAGLNLIIAVFAGLGLFSSIMQNDSYWLILSIITFSGLFSYGMLNAVADIATNLIDVGDYVRSLRKK
mgnify:CR=1 FL=1